MSFKQSRIFLKLTTVKNLYCFLWHCRYIQGVLVELYLKTSEQSINFNPPSHSTCTPAGEVSYSK